MTITYEVLKDYACRGMFFHGGPEEVETLRGRPLYASRHPAYAILYAISPRLKKIAIATFGPTGEVHANQIFIENMRPGYVYVLSPGEEWKAVKGIPSSFSHRFNREKDGAELVAYSAIAPLACFEVTPEDYPYPIIQRDVSELSKKEKIMVKALRSATVKRGFRNPKTR